MIAILIKSAIILAAAFGIATALRRQSAAMRHAVWTAGLIAALIIPFCSIALPAWQSARFGEAERSIQSFVSVQHSKPSDAQSPNEPTAPGPDASSSIVPNSAEEPRSSAPTPNRSWSLSQIGIAIWLAGAALGILIMLLGALRLAWVAFRAEPVADPRWIALAEDVRRSLGIRRPVRLLQSPSHFLGTWGILTPRVLLPSNAGEWTDDRAWMVLGHELAHIQRHDWVVQVLAEAARAIYWFNPVFWLAYSRLRRESEHACDDSVVRMGAAGTRYAEELLELARALHDGTHSHSPILAMAQPSHLERRLVALLNPALNRLAATPWSVIVVALIAIGLTLPLAAIRSPEKTADSKIVRTISDPSLPSPIPAAQPLTESVTASSSKPETIRKPEQSSEAAAPKIARVEAPPSIVQPITISPEAATLTRTTKVAPVIVTKGSPPLSLPPVPFECKVTPSYQETKMKAAKEPLGSGPWHINDDRSIWTWDQRFVAGVAANTMWMKPNDSDLTIIGRRLDGESAPLQAHIAKDATAGYIATTMNFPSPGCWEVTAKSGTSSLTFITKVESQ